MISRLRIALGTFVAMEAEAASAQIAHRGVLAAFKSVALVEQLMHPTRAGSDVAALRECKAGEPLRVHEWTWQVLELATRVSQSSSGAFDPSLATAPGRMTDLELLSGMRIQMRATLHLDLGGIAKGYAVDRAVEALRAQGCSAGLVNAGGDVAVFGTREHFIVCRHSQGPPVRVSLRNAALASSDTRATERPCEHRGYYHGAHRDMPVSGHAIVTAPSAAVADALTKCLLLDDRALSETLLRAFGATQIRPESELQAQAQIEA